MTRGNSKRNRIEGSLGGSAIENGATMVLDLTRPLKSNVLTVTLLKSRYGGEGQSLKLTLDLARQCVLDTPSEADEGDSELVTRIKAALVDGPLTQSKILTRVTGGRDALIAALKGAVKSGALTMSGRKFDLPERA